MANSIHLKIADAPAEYLSAWVGLNCNEILHRENDWRFNFSQGGVSAECLWRIRDSSRVVLTGADDGQRFGLPAPVNGPDRALELLTGRKIQSVEIVPAGGDLKIHFEGGMVLEFLVNSSGYESWNASAGEEGRHTYLVAQGGGQIAIFDDGV